MEETHRKKISISLKKNLPKSCFKKGRIPWNKGKNEDRQEVLKKMSNSHKNKTRTKKQIEKGIISRRNNGKPWHSSYTIKKMSNSRIEGILSGKIKVRRKDELYNWKGGSGKIYKKFRGMPELIKWRNEVFKRDNWTCKNCGSKKNINAHHIIPFMEIIKINNIKTFEQAEKISELWDINNGITLCRICHMKIHYKNSKMLM